MTRPGPHRCQSDAARARLAQRGMTMIEIIMVLAVIGLLLVVGIGAIRNLSKASLREDSTEITAVLRGAHNMATLSRKHHRVVFDIEQGTYRIEACEGTVQLRKAEREAEPVDPEEAAELLGTATANIPPEMLQALVGQDPARVAAALTGKDVPSNQCGPALLPNGDADGRGNERRVRREDGVRIRRIHVQHLEDPQLDGIVSVNFFPLGYAEKAVIEVGHEDGGQFTMVVHGLTGRVDLEIGEIDVDEFMNRNATGDEEPER
ncbi:MAG TPA: type II secretion system protein [Kofleriaceae bacterium]|nr:type II secretion system protein [Kofleriaceae bacterium]